MKVYHVQTSMSDYSSWFPNREFTRDMEKADVVCFEGGSDVHPSLYNEPIHHFSGNDLSRDKYELNEFKRARELNKPLIGICRGSQFLCVMAGGRLVQHQQNPHSTHLIELENGEKIVTTSSHHQAQFPFEMPKDRYHIIGWTKNTSKFHQNGLGEEMNPLVECEIVAYPQINALGIQGHPEWMDTHPNIAFYQELLNRLLTKTL